MTTPVPSPPWVARTKIPGRRRHRLVFTAAGIYNIAWGSFTVAKPQWLFELAGMPPANHPEGFAALGLVIGLYGILYLAVAAYPEHGWLCAAVGMTGKLLGPIGLAVLLVRGTWPISTIIICLTNDLMWWLPFARYLADARPVARNRSGQHPTSLPRVSSLIGHPALVARAAGPVSPRSLFDA